MLKSIFDLEVTKAICEAQIASSNKSGLGVTPFHSPLDWRQCWIYMLMIDRFNNSGKMPNDEWNKNFNHRQGGTFNGVREQLDYIKQLGAGAIWLSPILKNSWGDYEWDYHGYNTQDFLNIDGRFASDGNSETAEKEFLELVKEAHNKGLYIILDVVLNHTGQVFDYFSDGKTCSEFNDLEILNSPPLSGKEIPIRWMKWDNHQNHNKVCENWENLPKTNEIGEHDGVFPQELQRNDFFRRRGKMGEHIFSLGQFVKGDVSRQRQLVVEYFSNNNTELHRKYGSYPVLSILIRIHQYLVAKYDVDGFRIDTAKHIDPFPLQIFGNAMREYAISIGKHNFLTFGEISSTDEEVLASFVGRNTRNGGDYEGGFGIDSAIDFPVFEELSKIAKGCRPISGLYKIFNERKKNERELLSSHGEAGRFFVTYIDNHDHPERFCTKVFNKDKQLLLALGILFCLPGIPCLYYGTEQALKGTLEAQDPNNDNNQFKPEQVREAFWGSPDAFNRNSITYQEIQRLGALRTKNLSLCCGRLYFREVSGNGKDFGLSPHEGGIVAFSRILALQEVVVVANTSTKENFPSLSLEERSDDGLGGVLVSLELFGRLKEEKIPKHMKLIYSNYCSPEEENKITKIEIVDDLNFHNESGQTTVGRGAMLPVALRPMEIQIWRSEHTLN